MKKALLTFSCVIALTGLQAQITLNSSTHMPSIGSSFDYYNVSSPGLNISQEGANVTWDLSGLTGSPITLDYIDPANALDASSFPQADIVETATQSGVTTENYYSTDNSELTILGNYQPNVVRVSYTNGREFMKFPLTFGGTHSGSFSGTTENLAVTSSMDADGTVDIEADGYGTLILPYTTVQNVLRVRVVTNTDFSFMGFPSGTATDTIYLWYNAATKNHIASYTIAYLSGIQTGTVANYIDQSDLVTGGIGLPEFDYSYSFYPNPASDFITFNNANDITSVSIYSLDGKAVLNAELTGQKLDISDLEKGMYLLQYATRAKTYTEKLIIE